MSNNFFQNQALVNIQQAPNQPAKQQNLLTENQFVAKGEFLPL